MKPCKSALCFANIVRTFLNHDTVWNDVRMIFWISKNPAGVGQIGVDTTENEPRKDPVKETSLLSPLVIHLLRGEDLLSEWTIKG